MLRLRARGSATIAEPQLRRESSDARANVLPHGLSIADSLHEIEQRLSLGSTVPEVIEEFLPKTRQVAIRWARRLTFWDEARRQHSDQTIGIARIISRRVMRQFNLTLTEDGRVAETATRRSLLPPNPTMTFSVAILGEQVHVDYTPDYFSNSGTDLLTFRGDSGDSHLGLRPHALSESGYLAQFIPHDAVDACGGPTACATLFAEMMLRGQEDGFQAMFEGEQPESRRSPGGKPQPSRTGKNPGPAQAVGEHTVELLAKQALNAQTVNPPRQRTLC